MLTRVVLLATLIVTALAVIDVLRRQELQSRPAITYLLLFTVLFLVRVAGQLLVWRRAATWLPPMREWNLVPYPVLLPIQLAFLAAMTAIRCNARTGRSAAEVRALPDRAGDSLRGGDGCPLRRPHVVSFTSRGVVTADGQERPFDLVVAATGFTTGLEQLLDAPEALDERGYPQPAHAPSGPLLRRVRGDASRQLFEANRGARRLAATIDDYLGRAA